MKIIYNYTWRAYDFHYKIMPKDDDEGFITYTLDTVAEEVGMLDDLPKLDQLLFENDWDYTFEDGTNVKMVIDYDNYKIEKQSNKKPFSNSSDNIKKAMLEVKGKEKQFEGYYTLHPMKVAKNELYHVMYTNDEWRHDFGQMELAVLEVIIKK